MARARTRLEELAERPRPNAKEKAERDALARSAQQWAEQARTQQFFSPEASLRWEGEYRQEVLRALQAGAVPEAARRTLSLNRNFTEAVAPGETAREVQAGRREAQTRPPAFDSELVGAISKLDTL